MVSPRSQHCRVDAHCAAWRELAAPGAGGSAKLHRRACISQAVDLIQAAGEAQTQVGGGGEGGGGGAGGDKQCDIVVVRSCCSAGKCWKSRNSSCAVPHVINMRSDKKT